MKRALLALLLLITTPASAGISALYSHARYSADRQRILVMISPDPEQDATNPDTFTLPSGVTGRVHELFCESGCYDAQTLRPIWHLDWYAHELDLESSPDFSRIVRLHVGAFRGGPAVQFYVEGKLVRSYTCTDLLQHLCSHRLLPYTSWDWHTVWYGPSEMTHDGGFRLATARRQFGLFGHVFDLGYHEVYSFDLESGAVRSVSHEGQNRFWLHVTGLVAIPVICGVALRLTARIVHARLQHYRAGRRTKGMCEACGYDLRATASGTCPECGGNAQARSPTAMT
jgi:hypothetical protein